MAIPMYRACSFPALKLHQNITTHLHISHTCNFLPAVTRRRLQGLENVPDRDRTKRVEFPAGTPRRSPAAPREGAAFPQPDACLILSGSHLSVSNVKLHPGNQTLPIVSPLSTACRLLSGKVVSLHPFSMRMVSICPFYYVQPWSYSGIGGTGKRSLCWVLFPLLSPVRFSWEYF